MVRFVFALCSLLAISLSASPALAAANAPIPAQSPFGVSAVSDEQLGNVRGAGLSREGYLRVAARENADTFNGLTGQIMPVTFDNWLNDVAAPLIVANLAR